MVLREAGARLSQPQQTRPIENRRSIVCSFGVRNRSGWDTRGPALWATRLSGGAFSAFISGIAPCVGVAGYGLIKARESCWHRSRPVRLDTVPRETARPPHGQAADPACH